MMKNMQGDAGRLNALGEETRGSSSLGSRPCCIENAPGGARVEALILA